MPLPEDFAQECLYTRDAWFLAHADFFPEEQRVVGTCDTNHLGPLVEAQRPWPGHERHLPGAVVLQITGTLGQLYAVYVLGMRPTEGWIGFGTHIHDARFRALGTIGPPVSCEARLVSRRAFRETVFTRFAFRFEQEGRLLYKSEQTAAWKQSDHRGPLS